MDLATETVVKRGENRYEVQYGNDEGLLVEFRLEPVLQGYESEKANRPIYKDIEQVWITCPGKPIRQVVREATETDKRRFSRQYAAFKQQAHEIQHGTPLNELTFLGRGQILGMKAAGVHTVEQLAALPDNGLELIGMGGREVREKAQAFLRRASDNAAAMEAVTENKRLREELEAVKNQMAELAKPKETLSLKQEKK